VIPDQIERNLLILLNPVGEFNDAEWRFIVWRKRKTFSAPSEPEIEKSSKTVYCFERRDFLGFYLFRIYAIIKGIKGCYRKILFINDGLLSSMFDSPNRSAYKTFSTNRLPFSETLRQRLVSIPPLWLRAEKRYVVVEEKPYTVTKSTSSGKGDLEGLDFLFFSNPSGKLLLTWAETLKCGKGTVFKTSANAEYLAVMEKEFATMNSIAELQGRPLSLPSTGKRIRTGNRIFFTEEFVSGKTLREIFHHHSRRDDIKRVCALIDRLDDWFLKYSSLFQGGLRPLSSCFGHLFDAFQELYGSDQKAPGIVAKARESLASAAHDHGGVTAIVAHNDLWPGNFLVNGDRLVAIDWERATPDRAPFFDYYLMIISAVLEYHVFRIGVIEYSRAFRIYLEEDDAVSCYGLNKLALFLERYGFNKETHRHFLLLFLMEWSVQGYLALGSQTAMDRLVFGELVNFTDKHFSRI
jgi:hypothetical protein